SITGTFNFARHMDSGTPAVDANGRFVFEVWFDADATVTFASGGATLTATASKGAFLVSGKFTNNGTGGIAIEYDLGGAAGSMVISAITGLTAGTGDSFSFTDLTNAILSVNTAAGLDNLTQ